MPFTLIPKKASNTVLIGKYKDIPSAQQWAKDYGKARSALEIAIHTRLAVYPEAGSDPKTREFAKRDVQAQLYHCIDRWLKDPLTKNHAGEKTMMELYKIVVSKLCEFFRTSVNVLPRFLDETFLPVRHQEDGETQQYVLTAAKRETFRLKIVDGSVLRRSFCGWKSANTADQDLGTSGGSDIPEAGWCEAGFVMAMWDGIYMTSHDPEKLRFHSQYMSGERIRCAGEMTIQQGIVKKISNGSGHYRPHPSNMRPFLWYLRQNDVNLNAVDFYATTGDEMIKYNAEEFLMFGGRAPLESWRRSGPWNWTSPTLRAPAAPAARTRYGMPALR